MTTPDYRDFTLKPRLELRILEDRFNDLIENIDFLRLAIIEVEKTKKPGEQNFYRHGPSFRTLQVDSFTKTLEMIKLALDAVGTIGNQDVLETPIQSSNFGGGIIGEKLEETLDRISLEIKLLIKKTHEANTRIQFNQSDIDLSSLPIGSITLENDLQVLSNKILSDTREFLKSAGLVAKLKMGHNGGKKVEFVGIQK